MLFVDFPLIINQKTEVKGRTVKVRLKEGSCSPCDIYTVYYREVIPGNNASRWKAVNASRFVNPYNLELQCFKQYEIAVARWKAAEKLKPWKVKTGQGKKEGKAVLFSWLIRILNC